jgi:hypothetical protein
LLDALSNLLVETVFLIPRKLFVQPHNSEESLRALHDDTVRPQADQKTPRNSPQINTERNVRSISARNELFMTFHFFHLGGLQ